LFFLFLFRPGKQRALPVIPDPEGRRRVCAASYKTGAIPEIVPVVLENATGQEGDPAKHAD
jgi:hypothetical protein